MTAAPKVRAGDIFEALSESEIETILREAFAKSISIIGKCDDESVVIVKAKGEQSSAKQIYALLKSTSRIQVPQKAVFSFVLGEIKYLFKAEFDIVQGKTVLITPTSEFYYIQRRDNERLNIPEDYYAVFKFTSLNNRPFRAFGKIKNISAGGLAVAYRNTEPKLQDNDSIKGILNLSCRPPEDVEIRIKHVRPHKDGEVALQVFGAAFFPENGSHVKRRMTSVITDIYRDIFRTMDTDKKIPKKP